MFSRNWPKQRAKKRIEPKTINALAEGVDRLWRLRVAAPLEMISSPSGILIRLAASLVQIRPALTTGSVSGGSYSSPVSATVSLLDWSGSAWVPNGLSVTAYNCYSNSTAIASGKLVWAVKLFGDWFIFAADCSS